MLARGVQGFRRLFAVNARFLATGVDKAAFMKAVTSARAKGASFVDALADVATDEAGIDVAQNVAQAAWDNSKHANAYFQRQGMHTEYAARGAFPSGVDASQCNVAQSKRHVAKYGVVFNPLFERRLPQGVYLRVRPDVLAGKQMFEVKSGLSAHPKYVLDTAATAWGLVGNCQVSQYILMFLNRAYTLSNSEELFVNSDITEEVHAHMDAFANGGTLPLMKAGGLIPQMPTSQNGHSLFSSGRLSGMSNKDLFKILKNSLECIDFPLRCLNIQAMQTALPKFDNVHPHELVPRLVTIQTISNKSSDGLSHFMLPDGKNDGEIFLTEMLMLLGEKGSILMTNYEIRILNELGKKYPQYGYDVQVILGRSVDIVTLGKIASGVRGNVSLERLAKALNLVVPANRGLFPLAIHEQLSLDGICQVQAEGLREEAKTMGEARVGLMLDVLNEVQHRVELAKTYGTLRLN